MPNVPPKPNRSQAPTLIIGPKTRADLDANDWRIPVPPAEIVAAVKTDIADGARADVWRSRVPGALSEWYDQPELHMAIFRHKRDRGGLRASATLQIPEELEWWTSALALVREHRARLVVCCDTADQLAKVCKDVAHELPQWRRVALEQAYGGSH